MKLPKLTLPRLRLTAPHAYVGGCALFAVGAGLAWLPAGFLCAGALMAATAALVMRTPARPKGDG